MNQDQCSPPPRTRAVLGIPTSQTRTKGIPRNRNTPQHLHKWTRSMTTRASTDSLDLHVFHALTETFTLGVLRRIRLLITLQLLIHPCYRFSTGRCSFPFASTSELAGLKAKHLARWLMNVCGTCINKHELIRLILQSLLVVIVLCNIWDESIMFFLQSHYAYFQ